MSSTGGIQLVGRQIEFDILGELVTAARRGNSAALVLRGEPGIGKTALLDHAARHAAGCLILRTAGIESEIELAFASLHHFITPLLDQVKELPTPQREALCTALGLMDGEPPDRFLIGLAVLTLLTAAAVEAPVVCIVDDTQWLDQISAQTLAFVARRVADDPIAFIFAIGEPSSTDHLAGIDSRLVRGLGEADAYTLLASTLIRPLERQVRDRIVAEAHGNPLALLELPAGRSTVDLAFGDRRPDLMPMATRIERGYQQRLASLPASTRQLLLTAAAESVGDFSLVLRAVAVMGIDVLTAPAEAAGLIHPGEGVRFRHPLVRSAVYRSATTGERRTAHAALAEATDVAADPDRHAWHRAQASAVPDETIAQELEASADRAYRRGGIAAAAGLLDQAAALTPDPARRGARALAAAEAEHAAAAPNAAAELVAVARMCPLDRLQRARLARLEAQMLFARTRGRDSAQLLLAAAGGFELVDDRLARETYLEAISAAIVAARVGGGHGVRAVAAASRSGPAAVDPPLPSDSLLVGVATWLTEGERGFSAMRDGFRAYAQALLTDRHATMVWLGNYFVAGQVCAHHLWDRDAWEALGTRAVQLAREQGALTSLPICLMSLAAAKMYAGDLPAAADLVEEGNAVTASTGHAPVQYTALNLAAWRGDEDAVVRMLEQVIPDATQRGEAYLLGMSGYVTAVLYNGLGRYDLARAGARQVAENDGFSFQGWALGELVESAVRAGDREEGLLARSQLAERARVSGSDWASGIEARCDALLAELDDPGKVDGLYGVSIQRLERSQVAVQQARTHLLYGEWLRRQGRRRDARDHLRIAHATCTSMGLDGFAQRAGRELRAAGETLRSQVIGRGESLTPQELRVAQLAADGLTNPQIAERMVISPHTVEWHLRKVFAKLGVGSRRLLGSALSLSAEVPPKGR